MCKHRLSFKILFTTHLFSINLVLIYLIFKMVTVEGRWVSWHFSQFLSSILKQTTKNRSHVWNIIKTHLLNDKLSFNFDEEYVNEKVSRFGTFFLFEKI